MKLNFGGFGSFGGGKSSLAIGNTSVVVKAICLAVIVSYWLSYSDDAVKAISVTPGYFLPPHFQIWTAISHCFLEVHFWEVIVDVLTLLLVGKLVEPLWGAMEMTIFFFVVNMCVAVVSVIFYYFLYRISSDDGLLYQVHIHGLSGYLAGVAVAVKQIMPDHVLYRSPIGKLTNRNVPLLVFLLSFVMWAVGLVEGSYCTMFGSGLVISWIYLRFYQVHWNGSRGDMAESFSFPSFFPNVLQPPLTLLCNAIFSILVRIKVCKKPIRKYDVGSANSISLSLPGAENHDTERRRQIALKALSERLSKSDAASTSGGTTATMPASTAWPTIRDDNNKSTDDVSTAVNPTTLTATAAEVHIPIAVTEESEESNAIQQSSSEAATPTV